jgi:prephenate dehydratase
MIYAVGYPGSVVEEALAYLGVEQKDLAYCVNIAEMARSISANNLGILALGNSVYGRSLPAWQFICEQELKILDIVNLAPQFCVAAKSENFELVTATPDMLNLTANFWREHRSFLLKPEVDNLKALNLAKTYSEYATVCTEAEARQHGLDFCQKIKHQKLHQEFAVLGLKLASKPYVSSFLELRLAKFGTESLALVLHTFATHGVEVLDFWNSEKILEDFSESRLKTIFCEVNQDVRTACLRRALGQLRDANLVIKVIEHGGRH